MIVPFGWRNIASTGPCLEGEGAAAFADTAIGAATTESIFGFDRVAPFAVVPRFPARKEFRALLTEFVFDLPVDM
jgi:hypothetical protein